MSASRKQQVLDKLYPEHQAGGYGRYDARINYFSRVTALADENFHVLDFGAGRGKFTDIEAAGMRRITDISKRVSRFAAFDVDPIVLENGETEDRHFAPIGERLPFSDESFDLISAWMVVEHITDPQFYASEIWRILKPGGWFCACTNNRRGYVSLAARLIPEKLHRKTLSVVSPNQKEIDIFPTAYLLNTIGDVRKYFPDATFDDFSYYYFPGPGYFGGSIAIARWWNFYNWLMPSFLQPQLHIFVRKKPVANDPLAAHTNDIGAI